MTENKDFETLQGRREAMEEKVRMWTEEVCRVGSVASSSPLRQPLAFLDRQRSLKPGTAPSPPPSSLAHDDLDDDDSSVASTNAFTASTIDCSADITRTSAPTLSDARDFIMDRFLPASHAIACDSPQLPSGLSPCLASPSAFSRFNPVRSLPLFKPSPSTHLSRDLSVAPAFDDHLDDNDDEDDCGPQSMKRCGIFAFRCLNLAERSHSSADSKQSKETKKSTPRSRRRTLAEAMREGDTCQEVDMAAPKSRIHWMPSTSGIGVRGRSPLHRLYTPKENNTPNFFDAASIFSPSVSVSPYRNEPTTSPFLQSKTFLGLPRDRSVKNVNSEADGSPRFVETPLASGDKKIVLSKNGYVYLSPFSSVLSNTLNRPTSESHFKTGASSPSNSNAYSAERTAAEAGPCADSSPANASTLQPVVVNPVLQQSYLRENGADLAPKKKAVPRFISMLIPNSPNRSFETDPPVATLSPPLPKSPSESWLCRAIPLLTTNRSPLSDPHKASVRQATKLSSTDAPKNTKWEKIVKGSNMEHKAT